MTKSPDEILKELEVLAGEINSKESNSNTKQKKETKKSNKTKKKENIKEEAKLKEIKKSLDLLEKEVFIKIDNPSHILKDLIESKKLIKEITTTLMALTRVNKLREELVQNITKDVSGLKNILKDLEKSLNLDEYGKTLKEDKKDIGIFNEYIDTIENDIDEIRRNIGLAK